MVHGLFIEGELFETHESAAFLTALCAAFDAPAQVVLLVQPVGPERDFYRIRLYVHEHPNAGVLEISAAFGWEVVAMQSVIEMLARAGQIDVPMSALVAAVA